MFFFLKNKKRGFTLIELLVVVAIIGVLASVVLASLNTARSKGRDARRKHDLVQVRNALLLYYDKYGNWMEGASGCGNGGNGWFNYSNGTTYPIAMSQCLVNEGFTGAEIIDPTGGRTSNLTSGFTYMKYTCGSPVKTYIMAKLETLAQDTLATDATCCSTCDTGYGMNYYLTVE